MRLHATKLVKVSPPPPRSSVSPPDAGVALCPTSPQPRRSPRQQITIATDGNAVAAINVAWTAATLPGSPSAACQIWAKRTADATWALAVPPRGRHGPHRRRHPALTVTSLGECISG
jgi:hypothetical protein